MAKTTVTLELGGRVELRDFADGIAAFQRLIDALTPKKAGVSWVIEDLQPGSAVTTLRGEADDLTKVEQIVEDYEGIGRALAGHEDLSTYNKQVTGAANAIRHLALTVEYVRFETPDEDHVVYGNGEGYGQDALKVSIGAIAGRVQTLSNRAGLRFNLYDAVQDKAVSCYLAPGQEDLMRKAWDRRARVSGTVSREATTGRPMAVRKIMRVEILEDIAPGSYKRARGAVPWKPEYELPEEIVRQLRDA